MSTWTKFGIDKQKCKGDAGAVLRKAIFFSSLLQGQVIKLEGLVLWGERERVGSEGSTSIVVSLCKPRNQDFGRLGKHVECENHWLHMFLRLSKPLDWDLAYFLQFFCRLERRI